MTANPDRGPAVLAVTAAMIALSTLFVVLRFASRWGIVKRVTLDDWLILLAWVLTFGLSFSICYAVKWGLGRHEAFIPGAHFYELQRLEYTFSVLYNPALMVTKTSILVFYMQLAKEQRIFWWANVITMVVVNGAGLALTFLNAFQCRPLSATFKHPRPLDAVCVDITTLYLSSAPVNIITDLAILLLPMPLLKGMRLPKKQKIILFITFGFGVFVAVVDVIRIAYLEQAAKSRVAGSSSSRVELSDFSWYAYGLFLWSAVEVNVGIMCASVPALKPLVSRFMPQLLKSVGDPTTPSRNLSEATATSDMMAKMQKVPSIPNVHLSSSSPLPGSPTGVDGDDTNPLSIMDFLSTPNKADMPDVHRTDTVMTNESGSMPAANARPAFFDFVNMTPQKSIVRMSHRESFRPITEVTILFFMWGFAYGLLNTLNSQFQLISRESTGQTVAIHSAYFAGYVIAPLTFGRPILKQWGFKACYMIGLMIYGVGALVFWPSAVLTNFVAFFISNFIVGLGLSLLEVAANPFIVLCGPSEYGEVRLNLSQGVQAVGTVVSPLLAKKVLFNDAANNAPSLIDTQWTYLAICLFAWFLASVYYCLKIPEVSDSELEEASQRTHNPPVSRYALADLRAKHIPTITLCVGVFSMFCYVGVQECVGTSSQSYASTTGNTMDFVDFEAVAHTLFAVSRFLAAGAGLVVKPRNILLVCFAGCIVFSALSMNFHGPTAMAMQLMVFFFEGPLFPLIFAIALRGLGRRTKDAAVLLTAAIGGGSVIPPILYGVQMHHSIQYSFCVMVAVFAFGATYPLYLTLFPQARSLVDSLRTPSYPAGTRFTPNRLGGTPDAEHGVSSAASDGLGLHDPGGWLGGASTDPTPVQSGTDPTGEKKKGSSTNAEVESQSQSQSQDEESPRVHDFALGAGGAVDGVEKPSSRAADEQKNQKKFPALWRRRKAGERADGADDKRVVAPAGDADDKRAGAHPSPSSSHVEDKKDLEL